MSQTETPTAATFDGYSVTIDNTVSHRNRTMYHVTYDEGPNEGASRWAFEKDMEDI